MATHAERIAKLEAEGESRDQVLARIDRALERIETDLRVVRDKMLKGEGAAGAHKQMSARRAALIAAVTSLFGGGVTTLIARVTGH